MVVHVKDVRRVRDRKFLVALDDDQVLIIVEK